MKVCLMKGTIQQMNNKNYITVSQYSEIKGITKQAVYKQLNKKLKPFLIVVDNQKYIDLAALSDEERERLNGDKQPNEQPAEQPTDNPLQPFFESQIEEKDKVIESLLRQIESLQEQNHRLTELLQNSQILLAAEKKLYLEQKTSPQEEKPIEQETPQAKQETSRTEPNISPKEERKSFWGMFRRK